MDRKLLDWGRRRFRRGQVPTLWLFTDKDRLSDPRAAAARLPLGIAGVVFRHDRAADREALAQDLARICRNRRLALVIAGDMGLVRRVRAGVHLRGGRWPGPRRCPGFHTSSAHNAIELRRAAQAGASLVFLSPAFPTASHPGAPGLGISRWVALARRSRVPVAALGGIDGVSVRRLPTRFCLAVGAIGALA